MKRIVFVFALITIALNVVSAQTQLSVAKNSDTAKVVVAKNYGISNVVSLNSSIKNENPIVVDVTKTTPKKEEPQPTVKKDIAQNNAVTKKDEPQTIKPTKQVVKNDKPTVETKTEKTAEQKTEQKKVEPQPVKPTETIAKNNTPITTKTEEKTESKSDTKTEQQRNVEPTPVTTKADDARVKELLGEEYSGKLPKFYALIIGISKYTNEGPGLPSLDFPVKDATKMKQVLINRYAFETGNIYYLENPSRSKIIDTFEQLSNEVTGQDNLLIFYAGHGYYDKEKSFGYWLPADAKANGKSEWISNTTIRDYLGAIQAKHTLLISDACFGGSIFKSRGVMENMLQKVTEMYRYPSRRAMTSGNLTLVPDKSFFTEYLLKRLNDNTDAFLPSQTLFYRIYEPVTNNSPSTPQFGVVQGTGDEGGDFVFIKRDITKK